jgi:UDP-N-acetylglucosamine:LPS N-acetylglucosamine transferase
MLGIGRRSVVSDELIAVRPPQTTDVDAGERAAPAPLPAQEGGRRGRVVIVTASVGAGHDGAAREWARRLREYGFEVDTHDFLKVLPGVLGRWVRDIYEAMLHIAPSGYTLVFWLTAMPRGAALVRRALLAPFRSRVRKLMPPDTVAVLSTYPLASQVLGQLRKRGQLRAPAATFLTDFSVHRLWVAPGIDAHFAVHDISAAQARALGATNVSVTGPLVADGFRPPLPATRLRARQRFGLPASGRLALLVAGSWGVGDVERTAADIMRTGVALPVVVCGRNTVLRDRLEQLGLGHPLGWVDDMPELMRAVDVLVENAGGLTSLEAMASGLPVATYRPIPGHGRTNAAALDQVGVSTWIRDEPALRPALIDLMEGQSGQRQREAALALFATEPAGPAVRALEGAAQVAARTAPPRHLTRRVALATVMTITIAVVNATVGTRLAVAHGLNSVRPGNRDEVFVVVHPNRDTVIDTEAVNLLQSSHASLAVDETLAHNRPETVRMLVGAGVTPLNAGSGPPYLTGVVNGRSTITRTASAVRGLTGSTPAFYLSGRDVDAIDVATVSYLREVIVLPTLQISGGGQVPSLRRGEIILVECAKLAECELADTLTSLSNQAAAQSMRLGSLTELRQ